MRDMLNRYLRHFRRSAISMLHVRSGKDDLRRQIDQLFVPPGLAGMARRIFEAEKFRLGKVYLRALPIRRVRDFCLPGLNVETVFTSPIDSQSQPMFVGAFFVRDAVLVCPDGAAFLERGAILDPCFIYESAFDDPDVRKSSLRAKDVGNIKKGRFQTVRFTKPVFVFNVRNNKPNYWHLLLDNLPKTLFLCEHYAEPFEVLYDPTIPQTALNVLRLVLDVYGVECRPLPKDGLLKIESETIFVEDLSLRHFGDSASLKQFVIDQAVSSEDDAVRSFFSTVEGYTTKSSSTPSGWVYRSGQKPRIQKYFKHTYAMPPCEELFALYRAFKSKVLQKYPPPGPAGPRVTYIERNPHSAKPRTLANEARLLSELERQMGVRRIDFGELSPLQQIQVSAETDILVGVHGAGFANMLFLPGGARVIDLLPLNYSLPFTNEFALVAERLCLRYDQVIGSTLDSNQSFHVDHGDFQTLITSLDC